MSTKSVIIIALIFCVAAMLCICSAAKYRRYSSRGKSSNMQRIWYGYKVWTEQYPFMVKLLYTKPNGDKFLCSGSIITSKCVLTAAHCVKDTNIFDLDVHILRERHTVVDFIKLKLYLIPKEYNATTNHFDIALLVLRREIKPEEGDRLPVSIKDYVVKKVRIFGFGTLAPNEPQGHRLRYFVAETMPWKECKKATKSKMVNKHVICTKWMKSRTDGGDSGGPMIDWDNGRQVGVNSFVTNYKMDDPWNRDGVTSGIRTGSPIISAWLTKKAERYCY